MITKRTATKIEIEDDGLLFVQSTTLIEEDGVILATTSPHRRPLEPDFTHTETESRLIKIIGAVWTKEVIEEFKRKKEERNQEFEASLRIEK